ncbi:MAG: type II toxin-antitoxin system prevent-host-death family antitoxin [Xenococcaceae cyanobacterium]
MSHAHKNPSAVWTVADAKAKLSEILRRAREEGPQVIGKDEPCVVVSQKVWRDIMDDRPSLAHWLAKHPIPAEISLPSRVDSPRPVPFQDDNT